MKKINKIFLATLLFVLSISIAFADGAGQWPNTTSPVPMQLMQEANSTGTYGVRTSDGNYIIAMQNYTGISAQKIDSSGNKLWGVGGEPVTVTDPAGWFTEIVADNDGGAFITYTNINTQNVARIDSSGTVLWRSGDFEPGNSIENWGKILHDGNNGVYVSWLGHDSNNDVVREVTHLGPDGNVCTIATCGIDWNNGGTGTFKPVTLPKPAGDGVWHYQARLIPSDLGSLIVVYGDYSPRDNVYATKLNTNGTFAWNALDYRMIDDTYNISSNSFAAESDGSNGVYIGYRVSDGTNDYLKLVKINSSGTFTLGTVNGGSAEGVVVKTLDRAIAYIGNDMVSTSDGNGNLYLGWNERDVASGVYDTYVQKFNSSGVEQWTAGGKLLGTIGDDVEDSFWSDTINIPHSIVTDGSGGAIIATSRYSNTITEAVAMQRVLSNGSLDWGSGYIVTADIENHQDEYPDLVSDGTGGAVVSFVHIDADWNYFSNAQYVKTAAAGGGCGAGPGETCGEITIGCNLAGTISISNITPEATFEPRYTNFYQDATNAPLESNIQVDITDTRGYGSCGDASTLSIQSSGLALGASTLELSLGTALTQGNISCPDDNCVPDSAHLSDVATTPGATGSISTGADVLNLSEGFDGTIRLQLSGNNLEVVKPLEPISKGDYVGDITFTLI